MQTLLGQWLPSGKLHKTWFAVTEYLWWLGFLPYLVLPFSVAPSKDDYLLSKYTLLKSFPAVNTFQLLPASLQTPAPSSWTKHLPAAIQCVYLAHSPLDIFEKTRKMLMSWSHICVQSLLQGLISVLYYLYGLLSELTELLMTCWCSYVEVCIGSSN